MNNFNIGNDYCKNVCVYLALLTGPMNNKQGIKLVFYSYDCALQYFMNCKLVLFWHSKRPMYAKFQSLISIDSFVLFNQD